VILDAPPEVITLLRASLRAPMLPGPERAGGPDLDRGRIEGLLPHRGSFLLIDRITHIDPGSATIVCRYDLARARPIFAVHFPGRPLFPGVLQVEAIGQAGSCLSRLLKEVNGSSEGDLILTQILAAHFLRPVRPEGDLEVVARILPDGLFNIVVGQCLQRDEVCAVAAVRGIDKETEQ